MHKILNPKDGFSYRLVRKDQIRNKKNAGWVFCDENDFDPNEMQDIELDGGKWKSRTRDLVLMKISNKDKEARDKAQEKRTDERVKATSKDKGTDLGKGKETIQVKKAK